MIGSYDDIINLPRHISATRPQMSLANHAAQFSPFAALTGYDAVIAETARLTDVRIELDENHIAELDMKLNILKNMIANHPEITVTYFRTDEIKEGGAYITDIGGVKKIDDYERSVVLMNGQRIAIDDILNIECELFKTLI